MKKIMNVSNLLFILNMQRERIPRPAVAVCAESFSLVVRCAHCQKNKLLSFNRGRYHGFIHLSHCRFSPWLGQPIVRGMWIQHRPGFLARVGTW